MEEKVTLSSLFNSRIDELEQKLSGLHLPSDAEKVQKVIADYLKELFDNEGAFRQSLTQSEDCILQAAMSLLNAQQEMSNTIMKQSMKNEDVIGHEKIEQVVLAGPVGITKGLLNAKIAPTHALLGSGGGALVGNLVFGGWGAVFGAIAGTAITVYLSSRTEHQATPTNNVNTKPLTQSVEINTKVFITIISKICDSVDNLISTFRGQINRVVGKYENQPKPSLEKDYRPILENIQTLVGYSRTHSEEEKFSRKIQERIEDMAELLDTYNLYLVNYSEEKESWFEKVSSPNTNQPKMVYPAIVKAGEIVLMGKIFVPEN